MNLKVASRFRSTQGSILVFTVVVTALVGISLASYLTLVKSQNMANMRSQSWNATVAAIEAGIEDALTHLNVNSTNTLIKDGWTKSGALYWTRRTLSPDTYYFVTISNFTGPGSTSPVIESRGYVRMPVQVVSANNVMFGILGETTAPEKIYLARGVRADAGLDKLFTKGLVAKGQIDLKGNNIETDSFDSGDPAYSKAGLYDENFAKDNGDVATNSGLIDSLNAGNAEIAGKVSTGPQGTVDVGSNGSVGSRAWIDGGNTGIQPGWSFDDMNINFPEPKPPYSGGAVTPGAGVVDGTLYDYVLGGGNYHLTSLSMSASQKMVITGDAVLYVPGNIALSGTASIEIAEGGSLKLYVAGASAALTGGGVINKSGFADNFYYYGLGSNKQLTLSGNGEFTGVIYAPEADFIMNGGGGSTTDFVGASVTKTVTMNGHYKFHYDEDLAKTGPNRGYTIRSWDELTPPQVKSTSFDKMITSDYTTSDYTDLSISTQ